MKTTNWRPTNQVTILPTTYPGEQSRQVTQGRCDYVIFLGFVLAMFGLIPPILAALLWTGVAIMVVGFAALLTRR